jgi:formylglycine-generating enzyme required for sulfatase activity
MVRLPQGFCIDSTEVTRREYREWLETDPQIPRAVGCESDESLAPSCGAWSGSEDLPAACIDWCDAEAYCRAAGKRLCGRIGEEPASYDVDYADASTSEWFAACSAGGEHDYPYGDAYVGELCETRMLSSAASNVDCHAPSAPYDCIFDLSGNAREWDSFCTDGSPMASCRLRGGGVRGPSGESDFACAADDSAQRTGATATAYVGIGFRCCSDDCP